jgi:hypothetical protein
VRAYERPLHDLGRLVVQAEVVERELERLLRLVDERGDSTRNVQRRLAAVGECLDADQGPR